MMSWLDPDVPAENGDPARAESAPVPGLMASPRIPVAVPKYANLPRGSDTIGVSTPGGVELPSVPNRPVAGSMGATQRLPPANA